MSERIKEIKMRLENLKGLEERDSDDIHHDCYIGSLIQEPWCELYSHSKSDITYLLDIIEGLK